MRRSFSTRLPGYSLRVLFFSVLSLSAAQVFAQNCPGNGCNAQNCVNYDINAYPKIFYGVETSPGVFSNKPFDWNPIWNFENIKQTKISSLDIGGTDLFHGLLQYLPPSYNLPENATKKYPVIIYFHGEASKGDGSSAELCRLFKDRGYDLNTHLSIPGKVERNTGLFTQSFGGETYEYIVISPQFSIYDRFPAQPPPPAPPVLPKFPTADHVEDVIDYVEATYRIDPSRIYLTGFSTGANMIMEYAASSLERAERLAAIMPVSLCSQLYHSDNVNRGYDASYIGQAKLPTWFVYCEGDNCGSGSALNVPVDWVNKIKSISGHTPPRYTRLLSTNPATLYHCSDTLLHDAWSRAYDPNFTASFTGNGTSSSPNDGINLNMYQWFTQQVNAALPVAMKSYTARLVDGRIELKWVTTEEKDNASFIIERAGADQQYTAIGEVPGAVNHAGEKTYTFTDNSPLPDLSFYRLAQVDIDGKKTYFEIKRILNQKGNAATVIVSPNPFVGDASAFVSIHKPQKITVALTDMTGKIIQQINGIYGQGSSEIKLRSSDLSKGVYLLKVSGEDFNVTKKIIKR